MKIMTSEEMRNYMDRAQDLNYTKLGKLHTFDGINQFGDLFAAVEDEIRGMGVVCEIESESTDEELESLIKQLGGED